MSSVAEQMLLNQVVLHGPSSRPEERQGYKSRKVEKITVHSTSVGEYPVGSGGEIYVAVRDAKGNDQVIEP